MESTLTRGACRSNWPWLSLRSTQALLTASLGLHDRYGGTFLFKS